MPVGLVCDWNACLKQPVTYEKLHDCLMFTDAGVQYILCFHSPH